MERHQGNLDHKQIDTVKRGLFDQALIRAALVRSKVAGTRQVGSVSGIPYIKDELRRSNDLYLTAASMITSIYVPTEYDHMNLHYKIRSLRTSLQHVCPEFVDPSIRQWVHMSTSQTCEGLESLGASPTANLRQQVRMRSCSTNLRFVLGT